jgi:hypothetical protein
MIVAHVNPFWRLGLGKGIMLPGAANVHAVCILDHRPTTWLVSALGLAIGVKDRQPFNHQLSIRRPEVTTIPVGAAGITTTTLLP